jgi:hypothetical protein
MRVSTLTAGLAVAVGLVAAAPASGQDVTPLAEGVMAPDFGLAGATRHGVLKEPIRLSDYRGKTVVLAFFFRARTSG